MRGSRTRSVWTLVLLLVVGLILGGFFGEVLNSIPALGAYGALLGKSYTVFTLPSVALNSYILGISFGGALKMNLLSALGLIAAIFVYRRF